MRIGYVATDEVNQALAARMAAKCGAINCHLRPGEVLPDGLEQTLEGIGTRRPIGGVTPVARRRWSGRPIAESRVGLEGRTGRGHRGPARARGDPECSAGERSRSPVEIQYTPLAVARK